MLHREDGVRTTIVANDAKIWQLADTENRGFLTPSGFGVVLRLIGHAQAGRTPSAQLATQRELTQPCEQHLLTILSGPNTTF